MGRIVAVVQARTGSTRLPGKVLLPLGGRPVLERMLERVTRSGWCDEVVVATTTSPADDAIVTLAEGLDVPVFRGHATDLLDRHYRAALASRADHVVKIPSDCPLVDPAVIDVVLDTYRSSAGAFDYVSNLHPPTFPDGNDVEVMSIDVLAMAWEGAREPAEREHTTPYLWGYGGDSESSAAPRCAVGNVRWLRGDASRTHRVVLDYPADYDVITRVFEALHPWNPTFGVEDVVAYLDCHPEVASLNAHYRGDSWYARAHAQREATGIALGATS